MALTKVQSEMTGGGPAFSAYISSGSSIANNSSAILPYNTEDFDTNSCYNNTGSTVTLNGVSAPQYSFAPNMAGYYVINVSVYGGTTSGTTWVSVMKNGSEYQRGEQGSASCEIAGVLVYCNGTSDYIQAQFTNASGGSITPGNYSFFRFTGVMVKSA